MNPDFKDDKLVYDKLAEIESRDVGLLFQRLNFFLVGSAFLVAGFATLVQRSLILAYVINAAGFYLSIFFAAITYLNARIIWHFGDYLRKLELEKAEEKEATYTKVRDIVEKEVWDKELKNSYLRLFGKLFREIWNLLSNALDASKKSMASHTYLIPVGFSILWIIFLVILAVVPLHAVPWYLVLVFFSPLVIFLIFPVVIEVKRCRADKKKHNETST